jgi:hypothetical protein
VIVDLRYMGTSGIREAAGGPVLAFAPNLARPAVFFDAELADPVRFREAMSALHDVVVGDLRTKPRDKTAYRAWLESEKVNEEQLRKALFEEEKTKAFTALTREPRPKNLEADFRRLHESYWVARRQWARELSLHDPELFRHLVPCDPVVTVAPDVVFFEAFAKDESSYGCLTVDRNAFKTSGKSAVDAGLGTTNVDYSLALYEHFQTLRSYRPPRLLVDPAGFEVRVGASSSVREEKIDLPPSWLRGFGQLQAAMALPAEEVELSVDVVYSILAFLKRHREKNGPRSVRFELVPGRPPEVVLEPWETRLVSRGKPWKGAAPRTIKVWGRRRLFALARLLPLASRFDVRLWGTGLPSVWVARMGGLDFVLALSGWTANDWTHGSNLDQRFAAYRAEPGVTEHLARYLETARRASMAELARQRPGATEGAILGSLVALAKRGQVAYDYAGNVVRWRPILPVALSESALGPEPEEIARGKELFARGAVAVGRDEALGEGRRLLTAKVGGTTCEGLLDKDGGFTRAKCSCSYFHRMRLRAGPCRHLLALRSHALAALFEAPPPALATPGPGASTGAGTTVPMVLHLADPVLEGMRAEAARRGVALDAIAQQAWRIALVRVKAAGAIAALAPVGTAKDVDAKRTPQSFALPAAVAAEIQGEAARLDVTVSALFAAAWAIARDTMRLTSSLLD